MIWNIVITFFLLLIVFFPIIIWGYIFSYIDANTINKKRFFTGILGGMLSVFPILYMDRILDMIPIEYMNIFKYISEVTSLFSALEFGISLILFFLLLVSLLFILGIIWHRFSNILKVYLKNILVFIWFIVVLIFIVFFLHNISDLFALNNKISESPVYFWDIVFASLKLVIFYYILVAFIEESAKHFNFLQTSILEIRNIKDAVLFSIFIALGFSFIENILYLYPIYSFNGFSPELLKVYFFRSVFSVIVHIICSSIIAYYFARAYLLYKQKDLSFSYLKIFSFGIWMSILLHVIYDVALSFGFWIIMFLYFIFWYLYVSSIFYQD